MTVEVRLPNGKTAKATYRSGAGFAGYVRLRSNNKLTTVSGDIRYDGLRGGLYFTPRGKNAGLVQSV